jgi:hypothetical protein
MSRLHKLLLTTYEDKKLLAVAYGLILVIRIGLWLFPFALIGRWLRLEGTSKSGTKETDWVAIGRVVKSVRVCSRYVPCATCLTQALSVRALLLLAGQDSHLKIGVEKDVNERFRAHAWIEVERRIVIGELPMHHRFAVLESNSTVL